MPFAARPEAPQPPRIDPAKCRLVVIADRKPRIKRYRQYGIFLLRPTRNLACWTSTRIYNHRRCGGGIHIIKSAENES